MNVLRFLEFSAERTLRSIDESLQRMGVEYVDVIQVKLQESVFDYYLPAFLINTRFKLKAINFTLIDRRISRENNVNRTLV